MDRIDKTLFEPTKWLDGVSCLFRRMVFDTVKTVIKSTSFYLNKTISNVASKLPVSFSVAGFTWQSGSPTYTASYPIRCNNGDLTWVDDSLPVEYKRLTGLHMRNARFVLENFYLTGEDTLSFRYRGANGNVLGCFTSGGADDNYSFYSSNSSNAKYARYNGQVGGSSVVSSSTWNSVVMSPTGVTGVVNPSAFTPTEFTCSNPFCIGATSPEGSVNSNLYFEGDITVSDRLKLIPVERVSDGEIGWFDGETLHLPTEGTVESLGYDYSHLTLVGGGTQQQINIDGVSYTFPDLLMCAKNTPLDTVDIVGDKATVTRYSTVMKLLDDGGWTMHTLDSIVYFQHSLPNFGTKGGSGVRVISNDFTGTTNSNFVTATEYASLIAANSGILKVQARDATMTLDEFLSVLTERNNNGNPSYVIYSVLNPTVTEYTVEPIELNVPTSRITFNPTQNSRNYTLYVTMKYKEFA